MHEPNVFKAHAVYTKQLWADDWFLRQHLRAPQFSFACGPDTSDATLEYNYGNIMRMGAHDYAVYTPLDLSDRYVKIVVENGSTWHGICIDQMNERGGEHEVNGQMVIRGKQTFICRGLEFLLQRKQIETSYVATSAGEQKINRAIGFNLGAGLPSSGERQGNMKKAALGFGAKGANIFAETLHKDKAEEWTAAQIFRYLMLYQVPTDKTGVDSLLWSAAFADLNILKPYKPVLNVQGKTFFQVMNELIDRRRLMGWCVHVRSLNGLEFPFIDIFTFNANPVLLADGTTIPANTNTANWDFDRNNLVQRFTLATDDAARFDQVVAQGEPPSGCFTVGIQNGLLEQDWTTAQQDIYRAGATADAAYIASDDSTYRHTANQQARSVDAVKKVFRYFRIPPATFNGKVGAYAIWPTFNINSTLPSWWPGLRLQDKLPLRLEHDYTNPVTFTDAMRTGSKWEYQRPFAFYEPTGERAFFLDRPGRGGIDVEMESGGRHWGCNLRMQDDAFGIIIDAPMAHQIAKTTFTPIDDDDATDAEASIDYNYIYATVCAEGDGFIEAYYPPVILANPDTLKILKITVPNARRDYLVPGTVIDIDSQGNVHTTVGGYVRDDTGFLLNVARSSFEWYGQERKSIQVTIRDLSVVRSRGELVLTVGGAQNSETINSVVTKCTFDMRAGTATYLTQFAELDA